MGLLALILPESRAQAQCTLGSPLVPAPVSFEPQPKPPSPLRPTYLSSGFNNNLALYRSGANGPRRLLMQESYGYSVLDLSNPVNPIVLRWADMRSPGDGINPIKAFGDGQSYVQTIAVSGDGARAAFSMTNNATPPWHTVAGRPDENNGFTIWGDFLPDKASGTVIQQAGTRYIAYDVHPFLAATAADVTALPSSLSASNMSSETTSWPTGSFLSLAGDFLVYMAGYTIQVLDATNPGPPGNITGAYPKTTITSADFGGRTPLYYTAAVDPLNSSKLWVLAELAAVPGQNAPSFGLVSLTKGFAALPQSAGPLFQVPSAPGDLFANVGYASALIPSNGSLFVLMWTKRRSPNTEFRLYSTTAAAWGSATPGSFPVSGPGFSLTSTMAGFGDAGTNSIYAYVPTTVSAFVIPMTCQAPNTPASASVASLLANDVKPVKSCETGTPAECTVFLGDKISGTLTVVPQQPTSWNFDFDFHPSEDSGGAFYPHLRRPDNQAFGVQQGTPTSFTIVGPCDPNVAGVAVGSGTNCWASVKGNGAFAGGTPDFTGAETSTSPCKKLTFAFEALNQYGSGGPALSTLCWQVPAVRLKSSQILTGEPVDASGSDGLPAASGYSWYFGANPAAPTGEPLVLDNTCGGPTCLHAFPGTGKRTFNVWLKVPYSNGYVSPDCTGSPSCTSPLKVAVTDFVPKFLVNNSSVDQITVAGPSIAITNQSSKGAAVTGAYLYSLCQIPNGLTTCAPAYTPWPAMADPPSNSSTSTATIPAPAAGSWLLRIHVNISNPAGQEDWTPNTGAQDPLAFRLTVPAVIPVINVWVNGVNPCQVAPGPGGGSGCVPNHFDAYAGDALTAYSYVNGILDSGLVGLQWNFGSAFPASGSGQASPFKYTQAGNYTVTLTRSGSVPITATGTVSPALQPVTVVASVNPAWVYPGVPASFSCSASGGTGIFTYGWTFTGGASDSSQNPTRAFLVPGNVSGSCVVHDSRGSSSLAAVTLAVVSTGDSGPTSFFGVPPCRVLDTRLGGSPIGPSGSADRTFVVTGTCGIPSDARAIATNVSVTNVGAQGNLVVFGGNDNPFGASSISFRAGATRANINIIRLAKDGSGTIKARNSSPAPLDLFIDVAGYYK